MRVAALMSDKGEYQLNLTVHRDPAHLAQTLSGEKFQHTIEAVQTAFLRSDAART